MKMNWVMKIVSVMVLSAIASIWVCRPACASVLDLNLPNGNKVSILCANLNAVGFLDVCNWRELSGLETTFASYQGVDLNIAGIFTAPDKASAALDLTYVFNTKSVLITQINFGVWAGNDVYIQNGRFINMYGIKLDIPLAK